MRANFRTHKINLPEKQNGAALLLFILLLVVGASTLLVSKMNKAAAQYYRDDQAMKALHEAKDVLIGWAASHPYNPGTLVFPDRNGDSNYDGFSDCTTHPVVGNNLLLGKIPLRGRATNCKDYATLPDLKLSASDFFGEVIWYAVSKNLVVENTNYPLINLNIFNTTTDWITVRDRDGNVISDRVAFVLIAPGSAIEGQDRSGVSPASVNFLDSVSIIGGATYNNADTDLDFIIYPNSDRTLDPNDSFNDQLVFVTVDELMTAVEKRVLGEARQVLLNYRDDLALAKANGDPNAEPIFPWASPYSDPTTSLFNSLSGTREGHLAINTLNEIFPTAFDITWNITTGGVIIRTPFALPYESEVIPDSDLISGAISVTQPLLTISPFTGSECTWTARNEIRLCRGSSVPVPIPAISIPPSFPIGTTGTRFFEFEITYDGDNLSDVVVGASATGERIRNVEIIDPFPISTSISISVTDTLTEGGTGTIFSRLGNILINSGAGGDINVAGVNYDLGEDDDFPEWFLTNLWHRYVYVAVASGDAPGSIGCTQGVDCLTLNGVTPDNNIKALVISSGKELSDPPLNQNRVTGALASYFENQNSSNIPVDDIFLKNTYPPDLMYDQNFNDQVRIITP